MAMLTRPNPTPKRRSNRPPGVKLAQMKDVAERAGVSITTVSHIVNNTRDVAEQTRERVMAAMRELKYYKNAFGRRLARGLSDSFGLIISDVENPFFAEIIKTYEAAVLGTGGDILLFSTNYEVARAERAVRRMIENKVQGVAVMTTQFEPALFDELIAADIAVVSLDEGPASKSRCSIRIDYHGGTLEGASHLKELGHRRAALITGPESRKSAVTFREAWMKALDASGLAASVIRESANSIQGGAESVRQLLAETRPMPTAILCGNDLAAVGALRALADAGLRVPADISVIGADDIPYARYAQPSLTTIRVPRDELGSLAYTALARSLKTKRRLGFNYSLSTHLIVRESSGKARSK